MTDIAERLREAADVSLNEYGEADRYREAAAEIERLRAGLAKQEREILERAVDRMGWPEIHAYQAEMCRGQSIYEDAGGYFVRGLRHLFGLPQIDEEVITYQRAARAMIDAARTTDKRDD